MIKFSIDGNLYIQDETIELTSDMSDECGIEITGCHVKFDSTKSLLEDLAVHPDNEIDSPVDFSPPVQRIGIVDGNFRIEGKVVLVEGALDDHSDSPPRLVLKECRLKTNGYYVKPGFLFGTYEEI